MRCDHRYSCNAPVIFVRFYLNLININKFSKSTQLSNLMKMRPVGAALFLAGGRTDKTEEDFKSFAI
jgi:hypothetical protein